MNNPNPVPSTTPVLPPAPWYSSEVQRAQVFALVAGLSSTMIGIVIQLFGLSVDAAQINAKVALGLQLVNLGGNGWGLIKRAVSKVQPLTLTKGRADAMNEADPSILIVDPTKIPAKQ
jgi:hypothetical protein